MKKWVIIVGILIVVVGITSISAEETIADVEQMLEKAGRHIMLREYNDALILIEKITVAAPKNDRAYLYQAQAYIGLKDYDNAIGSYDKALNANGKSYMAWSGKGEMLLRELKYDEAQVCFENAIKYEKKAYTAMYNLAIIYARKDDQENCFKWLKKAVKKDEGFKTLAREEKAFNKYRSTSDYQNIVFK